MKDKELLQKAAERIKALKDKLKKYEVENEFIAIVSTACRFPGESNTPQAFWRTLIEGKDPIQKVSPERWPETAIPEVIKQKYPGTQWAGLVHGVDKFDADFFGIGAIEAKSMDPQQRILLEVSWEAFERAGLTAQNLSASRTGVFIGMVGLDYKYRIEAQPADDLDIYAATGNALCTTSGRISYVFGLEGPSITIETACSSSLVAVHQACLSLRARDCDLALVGGSNFILSPKAMSLIGITGALSPDGHCRTFDSLANGFVRSDGCGVVLLKRLSDAQRDKDNILGVIRGSAINQDGRSTGFTAPNVLSQQRLLKDALKNADIESSSISYIETHGTGTSLGDPIETEAIKAVFGQQKSNQPCILGAVKSNIGHLEAAAGIAGLIKLTLMFENEKIPPQLHFKNKNPRIELDSRKFFIPTTEMSWKRSDRKRIAGISSFGFSGTNVHVIIEEGMSKKIESENLSEHEELLVVSARTQKAVIDLAKKYCEYFDDESKLKHIQLSEICSAAATKRTHYEYRSAVTGKTHSDLVKKLSALSFSDIRKAKIQPDDIVFLFSNDNGIGANINSISPMYCYQEFHEIVKKCNDILKGMTNVSMLEQYNQTRSSKDFDDNDLWVLTIKLTQLAMAKLLLSWGIIPKAIIAEGIGSIIAKHINRSLSFEQAVRGIIVTSCWYQKLHHQKNPMLALEIIADIKKQIMEGKSDTDGYMDLHCATPTLGESLSEESLGQFDSADIAQILKIFSEAETDQAMIINFGMESQPASLKVFGNNNGLKESLNNFLGELYLSGYPLDFKKFMISNRGWESLPTYPWQHESYWIPEEYKEFQGKLTEEVVQNSVALVQETASTQQEDIHSVITHAVAKILGIPPERVRTEQHLFEIGVDSISAVRLINDLQKRSSLALTLTDLLREGSIDKLVQWLESTPKNDHLISENPNTEATSSGLEWDTSFIDEISESDVLALEEALQKEAI
ncbi:MAG: hypothetical protein BGO77_04500 [Caedibacter sp. 37-49]|nr:MAG: hypothetical protein BGO77_04500 [Caedibacter sp. 37-49]